MKTYKELLESVGLNEEHYSEKMLAALKKHGWTVKGKTAEKMLKKVAPSGRFSDGSRIVSARFDNRGRYLEAVLGFETLVDIDGREFENSPEAGAKKFNDAVEKKVKTLKETINEAEETTVEHGFDLTDFGDGNPGGEAKGAEKFKKILKALGLPEKAKLQTSPYPAFVWKNNNIEIMTGNDPVSGKYARTGQRDNQPGYASYIGITGNKADVAKAVSLIKKEAAFIKDESKGKRDFI